ncbi:hypothetical protein [Paraburkholderia sp. 32]|uniref:hypothetical protein n=1 Tax=Paraburkholderia sp. 32 TaxID=2991057 RepID=UPI003D240F66
MHHVITEAQDIPLVAILTKADRDATPLNLRRWPRPLIHPICGKGGRPQLL